MQLDVGSEPYLSTAKALCHLLATFSITSQLRIGRGLLLLQSMMQLKIGSLPTYNERSLNLDKKVTC